MRTDQLNFSRSKSFIPVKKYLDLDLLFDRITSYGSALKKLEFCGNIDEPLLHPHFLTLIERLENSKTLEVGIHTNGSSQSEAYFTDLAKKLQKLEGEHELRFSIDGLEDTNAIYRQRTKFSKIISNAKAFIAAGGSATWQFIVFPWNQHQHEEARALAESMGFKKFLLRKDRSIDAETHQRIKDKDLYKDSSVIQKDRGFSLEALKTFDDHNLDCYFKKFNMMFISWDGKLWPCCFTANIFYDSNLAKIESFKKNFYGQYDQDFNNLYKYTLEEILKHPIYENLLVSGWSSKIDDPVNSKLWRCVEKCRSSLEAKAPIQRLEFKGE